MGLMGWRWSHHRYEDAVRCPNPSNTGAGSLPSMSERVDARLLPHKSTTSPALKPDMCLPKGAPLVLTASLPWSCEPFLQTPLAAERPQVGEWHHGAQSKPHRRVAASAGTLGASVARGATAGLACANRQLPRDLSSSLDNESGTILKRSLTPWFQLVTRRPNPRARAPSLNAGAQNGIPRRG